MTRKQLRGLVAIGAAVASVWGVRKASAQTAYSYVSGASWSTATWTPSGPATGQGSSAIFNSTANISLALDQSYTLGTINFASDNALPGATQTVAITAGGGTYTMDNTGGTGSALIENLAPAGTLTIAPNINIINTDLTVLDESGVKPGITISGNIVNTDSVAHTLAIDDNSTGVAGAVSISGSIGASGSNIAIVNLGNTTFGITTLSGGLGSSVSSLTQASPTGILDITANNTSFSGAVNVLDGFLEAGVAAGSPLGSTSTNVLLGDTTGVASAGLFATVSGLTISNNITVQAGGDGAAMIGLPAGGNNADTFSGNIALNKGLVIINGVTGGTSLTVSGVISEGTITGDSVSFVGDSLASIPTSIGTYIATGKNALTQPVAVTKANTYTGGTYIDSGTVSVATTGALGTGNVVIDGGGLKLAASGNLNSGATVLVSSLGMLDFTYATVTPTAIELTVNSSSSGMLALDATIGATFTLDMTQVGDGAMYLGGTIGTGGTASKFAGTVLPEVGNVYRLGGGAGTTTGVGMTITSVLNNATPTGGSAGNDSVVIGSTFANSPYSYGSGLIALNANNTYAGGTTVNDASTLEGYSQATGTPFGSTTASVTLNGGTIAYINNRAAGNATTTSIGNLTFQGSSYLYASDKNSAATLNVASLTRSNNGILAIGPISSTLGGGTEDVTVTSAPTASNGIVAPYFVDAKTASFLNYAGNGFVDASTGAITTTGANAVVAATTNLTGNESVNSLSFSSNGNLTNTTSGAAVTVTINSGVGGNTGGLAFAGNTTIGSATATQNVNLAFGSAEGIVYSAGQNGTATIDGIISGSGGLTTGGPGYVTLNPTGGSNSFTGTVTVNQGLLTLDTGDGDLGPDTNAVVLNGGKLVIGMGGNGNAYPIAHPIMLGPEGGWITSSDSSNDAVGNTIALNGQITGTGAFLTLYNLYPFGSLAPLGNNPLLSAENTFVLGNSTNNFTATIVIDTNAIVQINSDGDLGTSTNAITLASNAVLQDTNTSGTISSDRATTLLNMGGTISVGGTATWALSGPIAGAGYLTKAGTGALQLSAASTLSGNTLVTNGTLSVTNTSGSATGTGAVGVGNSSATGLTPTLAGTGKITGAVTIYGTTVAGVSGAGSAGTLAQSANASAATPLVLGSLALQGGSAISLLSTTSLVQGDNTKPAFNVTGLLNVLSSGATPISISNTGNLTTGIYDLFNYNSLEVAGVTPGSGNLTSDFSLTLPVGTTITVNATNTSGSGSVDLTVTGPSGPTTVIWNGNVSGSWDAVTPNWQTSAIYADGDAVTFDDTASGPNYNVSLGGATVLPSSVSVNNSLNNYTIGNGTIGGNGTLTKTGTGNLTLTSANTYTGGTIVNGGTLIAAVQNAIPANTSLMIGGNGTVTTSATSPNFANISNPDITLTSLSVSGTLNLNQSPMVVNYGNSSTPLSTIVAGIVAGNITSSIVTASPATYGIGTVDTGTAVQVMPTLLGDTTLAGTVGLADYNTVVRNFNVTGMGWSQGGFDYSGTVGLADYNDVVRNFNLTASASQNLTAAGGAKGLSASALSISNPASPNTSVELYVNKTTGDVMLVDTVGGSVLSGYDITSTSGSLVPFVKSHNAPAGNSLYYNDPNGSYSSIQNLSTGIAEGPASGTSGVDTNPLSPTAGWPAGLVSYVGPGYEYDLGDLFKVGGTADLAFSWSNAGAANTFPSTVVYSGAPVPEPTSLGLLAIGATGLLARRRRKAAR